MSDTEVEIEQRKEKMLADSEPLESDVMWDWGGLPQESPRKVILDVRYCVLYL